MKTLKKWDTLSKEERNKINGEVIKFFQDERKEQIWFIQADEYIDFFLQHLFDSIYNKWIDDAQKILWERFQDFNVDLDLLKN